MRLSDLPTNDEVLAEALRDPAFREEWERTRFANEIAIKVLQYRTEHGLTQTALARELGMQQSAIARLEAGEHEPSLTTLRRLSHVLGLTFHIDITPGEVKLTA